MLVEINLLPKKESRNTALFVLVGVLLFILFIGIGISVWVGQTYKGKTERLNQEIATTKQLIEIQQEKINNSESANSLSELEKAVKWAEEYPIETVPILRKLTALLPERGFVKTIKYTEAGTIELLVQFDTSREASYYLKSMLDSDWIEDVKLISIEAMKNAEEEVEQGIQELRNERYIPRYAAEFEVFLNKRVIKDEEKGGNNS